MGSEMCIRDRVLLTAGAAARFDHKHDKLSFSVPQVAQNGVASVCTRVWWGGASVLCFTRFHAAAIIEAGDTLHQFQVPVPTPIVDTLRTPMERSGTSGPYAPSYSSKHPSTAISRYHRAGTSASFK